MESSFLNKIRKKKKRMLRTRRGLQGTGDRPRFCLTRSNRHLHVQIIDDDKQHTLVSVSTLKKEFRETDQGKKNVASGKQLGLYIARLALEKNIKRAVFDRGPNKYHGIVAAVAEGAREGGLEI